MDQIVTRVPAFEPIHGQVFSAQDPAQRQRAVREGDRGVQVVVAAALQKDDRPGIERLINEFASDSRVGGVDALKEDLARYDRAATAAAKKDCCRWCVRPGPTKFCTPIFAEHVDGWLARSLPPPEVIARHAQRRSMACRQA